MSSDCKLSWEFKVLNPGRFDVSLLTSFVREDGDPASPIDWEGGHGIEVTLSGRKLTGIVSDDFRESREGTYSEYAGSNVGTVDIDTPGEHTLTIRAHNIVSEKKLGLTLRSIRLSPVDMPVKPEIRAVGTKKTVPDELKRNIS